MVVAECPYRRFAGVLVPNFGGDCVRGAPEGTLRTAPAEIVQRYIQVIER